MCNIELTLISKDKIDKHMETVTFSIEAKATFTIL